MNNHPAEKQFNDLEIRISPRQDEGYPVEIALDDGQEFLGLLSTNILSWSSSGDSVADGQRLFSTLLADAALRSAWDRARGQSVHRRIRLHINTNAPELHALPWELLYEGDTLSGATLSANANTPFSRYLPVPESWGDVVKERPIRVLAVISNPQDLESKYSLPSLNVEVERDILEQAFSSLEEQVLLDLLAPPVTLERIEEAFQRDVGPGAPGYHVFHFVGHGAFGERRRQTLLYLQDEEGNTNQISDADFSAMLNRQSRQARPRLIFLAACQSATRLKTDALVGLAPRLVTTGVPAVVAMREHVAIETARKLSQVFYRRLVEHGVVDYALNQARSQLLTTERSDASVPVLFMRLKSGQLWSDETEEESISHKVAELRIPPPPKPISPPESAEFVGRKEELENLANELATSHLAAIVGMPGVGKTALAAKLAGRVGDPHKTFWHTFYRGEGVGEIISGLADFLFSHGHKEPRHMLQLAQPTGGKRPSDRDLLNYLAQMIQGQGFLLCLDDFQFLSDADVPLFNQFVQRLLDEGTLLIVTSRHRPGIGALTKFEELAGLNQSDTLKLLASRGLSLSENLAIDLWTHTEGNATLLTLAIDTLRKEKDPARIIAHLADTDNIEHYLMSQIDANLTEDEQAVMSAVAALLGYPGTRDAIEIVVDGNDIQRTLSNLSRRYLLVVSYGERGREYKQHAMVQAFYYNLLGQRERQKMHHRAGEYYEGQESDILKAVRHYRLADEYERAAGLATADVWSLINQGQAQTLRQLLEQFTVQQLNPEQWAAINVARGQVYALLGEGQLVRESSESVLSTLKSVPDSPTVHELRARACLGIGDFLEYEEPKEALNWLNRGLDELKGASQTVEAALHIRIGSVQSAMAKYADALISLKRGLELLPEGHNDRLRISALANIGMVYCIQGDMEQGNEYTLRALQASQRSHNHFQTLVLLSNRGIDREIAGDWQGAFTDYQDSLDLAKQLGSSAEQARIANSLAVWHIKRGDNEPAVILLSDALRLARSHNLRLHRVYLLHSLTDLQIRMEEWDALETTLNEAEQLAVEMNAKFLLPHINCGWAQVQLERKEPQKALERAEQAVNLAREQEMSLEEGTSLRILGQVLGASDEDQLAMNAFEQSLSLLENDDPYEAARTKAAWGNYLLTSGKDAKRGKALLQDARVVFEALGAQWDLARVDKGLEKG